MTTTNKNINDLEDFEAFLEPDFEKLEFANDLLLATNDNADTELDIATSVKKLKFDIDECDKRMKAIASRNRIKLVSNFSQVQACKSLMNNNIHPSIERVNVSFQRIKTEIIKPYENAIKINDALKRIHSTVSLLRGATSFIFLIQLLEDLEKSVDDPENFNSHKDLIRLAKLHLQISLLYKSEDKSMRKSDLNKHGHMGDPSLLSIKLIREYRSVQESKKVSLTNRCNKFIINELSHSSSFNVKNVPLQCNLIALFILDKEQLFTILEKSTINKQVQLSSSQLSRSLQSPRNFLIVLTEVKSTSDSFLNTLEGILLNCDISNISGTNVDSKNLLENAISHLKTPSISLLYWENLAFRLKKSIAATMARGGPIALNLKSHSDSMKSSIIETFGSQSDSFLDAISVILQSI
ncbi:uncharacterized protein PRCAT00003310001 [Priceomyces carsonii]|uniref:uncharacterized protein n=1 Tax=Priceomyces carsonii TaxID=28549 RepID=UPI002ED85A50|nr:unnamed protein product [Priceomyces carsonii]